MRVLILTQWYPPEPALLLQELAQSLRSYGHEVTVLTGFPNYPTGRLYPGYRLRIRQREVLAGISVVRVPLYPDHSRSGLRRALNYVSFALSTTILGPWRLRRPDVIFVYHPPLTVGLPAYVLSRLWRAPFVYQIQDMWPETLAATGMLNDPRILRWIGVFARWVYAKASAILVISAGFKQNLLDKGVPLEKIHVISNWVDTATYYPDEPDPALAAELGMAGRFNIVFAGNMGEAQGLQTVVEAADLLRDVPEVQFVLVGDGTALPALKQTATERDLKNVRFLPRRPATAMSRLYALADVLLVHLKDEPLFRITIPHKILAYLGVGKPILAAVEGDAADLVNSVGAGITCAPENPTALAAAVRQLWALPASERRAMGARGLIAARERYSREVLTAEIESVLRQVVEGAGVSLKIRILSS